VAKTTRNQVNFVWISSTSHQLPVLVLLGHLDLQDRHHCHSSQRPSASYLRSGAETRKDTYFKIKAGHQLLNFDV
jgi:hypothetical protein